MEFPGNPPLVQSDLSSDEKTMAALSHIFGWIVALIVYFTQRKKSKFVRFQSLQALLYDVAVLIFILLLGIVILVVSFILGLVMYMAIGSAGQPSNQIAMALYITAMTLLPMLPILLIFPVAITIIVFRIIASIRTWQGYNYRYPVIGKLAERWSQD